MEMVDLKGYMLKKFDEYHTLYTYCREKGKTEHAHYNQGVCVGIAETLLTLGIITNNEFDVLISRTDKDEY